ncbi:hypothetical protein [Alteromonas mediterranea]|uniref:Uncharacterized protein n=1 Tax=Alteromonas mediterranea (strain DSM 17117 / CIP 110805 / LMG 28347 / Deep ecotype) TaxID=1774373 RepID=F2GCC1_ALTMD|nr:hypothetical protein [Alteromonas mediterranea]AEA99077.1 hypothetical protein MADE_1014715 [Alteromonas mediterranea DE]
MSDKQPLEIWEGLNNKILVSTTLDFDPVHKILEKLGLEPETHNRWPAIAPYFDKRRK